jgi:hypothetical protein
MNDAGAGVMTIERLVERVLTAHETYWDHLARLLRALETDEEAAWSLHRHVRDAMGHALLAGYEGREPTPSKPPMHAHHKAQQWVGMQLLRDIGPHGMSEVDWIGLGRSLTALAGPRIKHRLAGEPPPEVLADHIARLESEVAEMASRLQRSADRTPRRASGSANDRVVTGSPPQGLATA